MTKTLRKYYLDLTLVLRSPPDNDIVFDLL